MDIHEAFEGGRPLGENVEEEGAWAKHAELPDLLPETPDLPTQLVPDGLRPWIMDASERAQVPTEFVAAPAIVAASSVIGRSIGIYPKQYDDWLVVPNLWGMLIGRPGLLKSPAVAEALKPVNKLAVDARTDFEGNEVKAKARKEMINAQISAAKDDAKSAAKKGLSDKLSEAEQNLTDLYAGLENTEATERRYVVNDGTVEKIGELLNQNPRGLLLCRDELSGLLRSLDKVGREGDREFYLEAWNGSGNFTYDRIGRGTLHIPALCLSVFGTIQPGKLHAYISGALKGGMGDDGLLQRLQLAVWPDFRGEWRNVDRWPDSEARQRAYDLFAKLDQLEPEQVGGQANHDGPSAIRFDPAAQELFDEWRGDLEMRLRSRDMEAMPSFESHLAKYRSLMPSLALILHLMDVVSGIANGAVSLDAAQKAAAWTDFLEGHAKKIYAAEINTDLAAAHALSDKIIAGAVADQDPVRAIYRHHWTGLAEPSQVWPAIKILTDLNHVRVESVDTSGRPMDIIRVHPDLRKVA